VTLKCSADAESYFKILKYKYFDIYIDLFLLNFRESYFYTFRGSSDITHLIFLHNFRTKNV